MMEKIRTIRIGQISVNKAVLDYTIMFLLGSFAMLLHAVLRIPMRLPGHHGIEFMALLIGSRLWNTQRFSSSMFSLGVASVIFMPFMGFHDPFMSLVYVLPGLFIDVVYIKIFKFNKNIWLISFAAGIAFLLIPVSRFILSMSTGIFYGSLLNGLLYPVLTHFIFAFIGSLIGAGVSIKFKK